MAPIFDNDVMTNKITNKHRSGRDGNVISAAAFEGLGAVCRFGVPAAAYRLLANGSRP
jgi:hypothetical protein